MPTWIVKTNTDQILFTFQCDTSMGAINKLRKWCRINKKEYGVQIKIQLLNKQNISCDNLKSI